MADIEGYRLRVEFEAKLKAQIERQKSGNFICSPSPVRSPSPLPQDEGDNEITSILPQSVDDWENMADNQQGVANDQLSPPHMVRKEKNFFTLLYLFFLKNNF